MHRHLHSFPTRRSSDLMRHRTCYVPSIFAFVGSLGNTTQTVILSRPPRANHPTVILSLRRIACLSIELGVAAKPARRSRSEEHTSELQSQFHLVCRLLL